MSGQPCVFSCRMTVPSSLHRSLSTPCWRNILPPLPLLLICQLLIRRSAYLLRNPKFVKLFFFSFPAGSAGGADGLRPQHIHDLLMSREAGSEFLSALTAFDNLVLAGRCPSDVAPVFLGGRLLDLSKKSEGFRPIVIGFEKWPASVPTNSYGINHLKAYFYPHQLGVGTPGGCEAAVHAARRYLESLASDHVLVKLDFTNAFSSLNRRELLLSVYSRIPELYAYCQSAYRHSSCLFFGPYMVLSEECPQQGDPIGPLLFSNTIHPKLSSLESCLNLGYHFGWLSEEVAADIREITRTGASIGLSLNVDK